MELGHIWAFLIGVLVGFTCFATLAAILLWKRAKKEMRHIWIYLGPVGWIWWLLSGMPDNED